MKNDDLNNAGINVSGHNGLYCQHSIENWAWRGSFLQSMSNYATIKGDEKKNQSKILKTIKMVDHERI